MRRVLHVNHLSRIHGAKFEILTDRFRRAEFETGADVTTIRTSGIECRAIGDNDKSAIIVQFMSKKCVASTKTERISGSGDQRIRCSKIGCNLMKIKIL